MEERIARLETNVEHIQSDVSDIKIEVRRLGDKIDAVDQKLSAKIDAVDQKWSAKIDTVDQKWSAKIDAVDQKHSAKLDSLKESVTNLALSMEKSFAQLKVGRALDRVWWLLMSAALLGIMARGLKWL